MNKKKSKFKLVIYALILIPFISIVLLSDYFVYKKVQKHVVNMKYTDYLIYGDRIRLSPRDFDE